MASNTQTTRATHGKEVLLHYGGYWTKATRANQRYVKGKEVKLTVDPNSITYLDIISQVPQVEGSNHAVIISYKSPSSASNSYVELKDNAGLVKMFDECRAQSCIELYTVVERVNVAGKGDDMRDSAQECLESVVLGDSCMSPLTGPSEARKRKRILGSENAPVKEAKKCEGSANHVASVLNSAMLTLEVGSEILETEELWNLIEKLEATLRRLRLRSEKMQTSSPIEIEDDEEDLIDSLDSDQNNIAPGKGTSPEDIIDLITPNQSDDESEQIHSARPTLRVSTSAIPSGVACTGKSTVGVPAVPSDSTVNNMVNKEALIELYSNLVIAENVPENDKVSLNMQLSMLKAGSKAIVMFLKCPFDEKTLISLETFLLTIQDSLTPEFDKYFGTRPREQIQGLSNFVSRIRTFQTHDCISEAELIYEKNIEKCKNAVKRAEKDLQVSLNKAIKACEKSRRSKERFRDVLLDLCMVVESLDCALMSCVRKRERRRNFWRDYFGDVLTVEKSRRDLSLAEESHAIEVLCISGKILEERKQKLVKESEALLASMMTYNINKS